MGLSAPGVESVGDRVLARAGGVEGSETCIL